MTTSPPIAFDAEKETLVLDAVERFVDREIKPVAQRLEHADEWPADIVAGMREMGLFGCIIREEYGGLGLSASTYAKVVERIARVWMSVSGIINSHLIMAACVQRNGTEAQRQRFLPRFASGELRGGLALTEPDCGTDLQAVRTVARRDGDHYVINGTKTWISNGVHGQAFAVLVKTDPAAQPRPSRHEPVHLRKRPRLHVHSQARKARLQRHRQRRAGVRQLSRVGRQLGRWRGRTGFQARDGRTGTWAHQCGCARRGCGARLPGGVGSLCPTASHLRQADLRTPGDPAQAGRHGHSGGGGASAGSTGRRAYDAGQRCDMEAGMAKLFASEAAVENSMEALRIHGAYGYSKEMNVERYYRDAPLLCIGEGTNELQRLINSAQLVERSPI